MVRLTVRVDRVNLPMANNPSQWKKHSAIVALRVENAVGGSTLAGSLTPLTQCPARVDIESSRSESEKILFYFLFEK